MLGKGLESLIPPISDDDKKKQAAPGAPVPSAPLSAGSGSGAGRPPVPVNPPAPLPAPQTEERLLSEMPAEAELPPAPVEITAAEKIAEPQALPVVREEDSSEKSDEGRLTHAPLERDSLTGHESVFQIEVDKIIPNRHQPRRHFDEGAIRDLAESIREFGIIQPLVVTKIETETAGGLDVGYELIAGERRLLAAKRLGLPRVPAVVRSVNEPRERLELAIIENIQRENLNPIETARAFARLQDEFRFTQREIASRLGKSREAVANTMRLLDLPSHIQEAISKGEVSESHGRLLLGAADPKDQERIFRELLGRRFTTRELRRKIKDASGEPEAPRETPPSPELRAWEERLSAELGAPVRIEQSGATGKITIRFFSQEELENIVQKFGKEE